MQAATICREFEVKTKAYLFAIGLALAACSSKEPPAATVEQPAAPQAAVPQATAATSESTTVALTRIDDPSTVGMVNDRYMGSPQIPVSVEGKTYYGCCKMCEKRLNEEVSVRTARDPVSNQEVDKAVAVMAKDSSGAVFYFADAASFAIARDRR
jgi:YHS domain-containing protein